MFPTILTILTISLLTAVALVPWSQSREFVGADGAVVNKETDAEVQRGLL